MESSLELTLASPERASGEDRPDRDDRGPVERALHAMNLRHGLTLAVPHDADPAKADGEHSRNGHSAIADILTLVTGSIRVLPVGPQFGTISRHTRLHVQGPCVGIFLEPQWPGAKLSAFWMRSVPNLRQQTLLGPLVLVWTTEFPPGSVPEPS